MAKKKKIWKTIEANLELLAIVDAAFGDLGRELKKQNDSLKPGSVRKKVKKYNN